MRLKVMTTRPGELDLEYVGGQPVIAGGLERRFRSELVRSLGREAGQDVGDLFAAPVLETPAGAIDWYAAGPAQRGPVQIFTQLSAAMQAEVQDGLMAKLDLIRGLAATSPAREILEAALQHPGPDYIYLVGGYPVHAGWGARRRARDLTKYAIYGYRPPAMLMAPARVARAPAAALSASAILHSAATRRVEEAGGKIGAINVIMRWHTLADLDLMVECPGGNRISYGCKSACGGTLDVDMNFDGPQSTDPVENVVFPEGQASPGHYSVTVVHSGRGDERPVPFEVILRIRGTEQTVSGVVSRAEGIKNLVTFDVD